MGARIAENAEETYRNKKWLEEQMKIHGSGEAIAKSLGMNGSTIQRWLNKLGVKNGKNTKDQDALYKNKKWLISQYKEGKTVVQVAKEQDVTESAINRYNQKFKIDAPKLAEFVKYPYKDIEWLKEQVDLYGNGLAVAKANNLPPTSVNRYITKFGLVERKYETKFKANLDVDYFEKIDTEEKAYWLGFIMADGNMYKRTDQVGSKYTMSIKLKSTDQEHLEKFKKAIVFDGDLKIRQQKRLDKTHEAIVIRVNNLKFCNDLIKLGVIPRKGGTEHISPLVPGELIRHFIRGYFDGDGHVNTIPQIVICTSDTLYNQLFGILSNIGIENIYERHGKGVKLLKMYRKKNTYQFLRYIYKDATIFLDRKYRTAMEVMFKYESAL